MVATRRRVCAGLAAGLLSGAADATPGAGDAGAAIVDARDYDAFWLWAGVRPQSVLATARRLYLLQGEVKAGDPVRLVSRRPAVPHVPHADVWLVVRAETLAWPAEVYATLLRTLARWRVANRVVGVQIDFDARTRRLAAYAAFLATCVAACRRTAGSAPPACSTGAPTATRPGSQGWRAASTRPCCRSTRAAT